MPRSPKSRRALRSAGWSKRRAAIKRVQAGRLAFEPLEPRQLLTANVLISEFMADNDGTLVDGFGNTPDWIELQNTSTGSIDLTGWKLQDSGNTWTFPAVTLPAQSHLVVFASDEDTQDGLGYWHTNFKLSAGGEYLALLDDNDVIVHEYLPEFPEQLEDISYGVLYDEEGQEVLVDKGDAATYLIPTAALDPTWADPTFDDSGWTAATTGLGFGLSVPDGSVTLINQGSSWNYLDDGTDQGTAWRGNAFDDSLWAFGPAELGYGDGGEATVLGYGPNAGNKYVTSYFRHDFDVNNVWAFTDLTINLRRDDGAVVYLNGQEIARSNMPPGVVNFNTYASSTVGGGNETAFFPFVVDPTGILLEGGNVLAVEIHQGAPTSSDISFDLELIGDTSTSDLIETDLIAMLGVSPSALIRVPFNVIDPLDYADLTLEVAYEDGYVAYLNGTQIAVRNAPASPAWNSTALSDRLVQNAVQFEGVDITEHLGLLVAGENILAIHALNDGISDGMFLIAPRLTALAGVTITENYFTTPTPESPNIAGVLGIVGDTQFSVDRGFYDDPIDVQITSDTGGAEIRYTLDGSPPTATTGTVYTNPIHIDTTTVLRAAAYKPGFLPTNVDTHTYIYLDDVLQQPTNPAGFPATWNGTAANYQVDPEIVNHPSYADEIKADMRAIPTVSIVTTVDDMFGPSGIYSNPGGRGAAWERPASVEWIETDGDTLFQVNAGVQIVGGASRGAGNKKHSFRISFKSQYGPGTLKYPIFGDDAAQEFNTFTLRAGFNDVWPNASNATYLQDRWAAETQLAMGGLGGHGNFVHLYVDGLYWGLYNPVERPDDAFAASYLGGEKEDYDAYHTNAISSGTSVAWNKLQADVNALPGLAGDPVGLAAKYAEIELELDIPAFIDYFMVNHYAVNGDWPHNNWWGTYDREGNGKWMFHSWDAEFGLRSVGGNNVNSSTGGPLGNLYAKLRNVEEFKSAYADRIQIHFFNEGALTLQPNLDWLDEAEARLYEGIVGESARWGDGYNDSAAPRTRDGQWIPQMNWLRTTFFPARSSVTSGAGSSVLQQYKNAGLYPNVDAPSFNINGLSQHGGLVDLGDLLTIDGPAGVEIYYTLDGSDPRPVGGGLPGAGPGALYTAAVPLTLGGHAKSRAWDTGTSTWSALNEAKFYVDVSLDIRVTELMYNPADPTVAEFNAGFLTADDFEFIEITNTSNAVLPLDGLKFDNGIDFAFPSMTINPGEYVVVVSNLSAFNLRYGSPAITIAGEYGTGIILGTQLSNAGEGLELDAPIGGKIQDFDFVDGWYDHTDGGGFSLTIRNAEGGLDNWDDKDGWRPSNTPGGSPGYEDLVPNPDPESVIITELLTHTDGTDGDVIELRNVSGVAIDVGGWWLSDQKKDEFGVEVLTKYQIPPGTVIEPKGYVVLNETAHFGGTFALSELGDDVYLSSDASGVAGGYREHVDFGGAPNGISSGLHIKSTGGSDITLLRTPFLGQGNSAPYFEDLVINEVMYHPQNATPDEIAAGFINDDDFEFVEIYNRSTTTTHTLSDFHISSGVGFTFGWYDADSNGVESWTLEAGATATWSTNGLPAGSDTYEVFARWDLLDAEGGTRDLDGKAAYSITHDGGTTDVVRDQKPEDDDEGPGYIDINGWVSLGSYDFDTNGEVVLTRGTNNPDNWTIADQVKFVSAGHTEIVDNPTLDSWNMTNGPATLGPGEYAVIVRDRAAFDYRYNFPQVAGQSNVAIAGQYTGTLSNSGDGIKLMRVGTPEPTSFIPYYRIDYVNYNDKAPWPTEPDGDGPSLSRNDPYGPSIPFPYGNDPESWFAGGELSMGTPGKRNTPVDATPPTVPQNLSAVVNLPYAQVALNWDAATDADSYVDHYAIYRDGSRIGSSTTTDYVDATAKLTKDYSYKVAAVNRDGIKSDRSIKDRIEIPALISHSVPDDTHISLVFSEPLDQTSAEDHLANYAFDGTLISATLEPDTITVTLTTAAMNVSQAYNLTIDSLLTVAGALMPPGRQVSFVYGAAIGANAPTVAAGIADFSVSEDAANSELVLSTVFADADAGDHLTFTVAVNTNPDLVQASIGAGELHLDYAADHNGTVDITVRATDVAGTWVEDTFTVTVDSIGDNPSVALPIGDVTVDEDADDTVLNLAGAFFDPDVIYFDSNIVGDDDLLTLTVTGNTDSGLVTASIVGGQLTLTYQGDQHGSADITVRATDDSTVNFIEDTFTVTVNPVNDPPVVSVPLADVSVVENAAPTVLNLAAAFGDVDIATAGDNLTYSITGNTNPGLVDTSVVGTLTYASNTYGTAQITVRATDTLGDWAEETFAVGVGSAGLPTVDHVLVRSSSWSDAFLDYLDGNGLGHSALSRLGYRIPAGGIQLDAIPWNDLDTLVISFSKDVNIDKTDLALIGVNVASYDIAGSSFSYDAATFTATWTLAAPMGADKLLIDLDASSVTDTTPGALLDGESGAFPSGNGSAGGDFQFRFNVVPGDADQNDTTEAADATAVRGLIFASTGDVTFSEAHDLDGSGRIDFLDWAIALTNSANTLPGGNPVPPPSPPAPSSGPPLQIFLSQTGPSAEEPAEDIAETIAEEVASAQPLVGPLRVPITSSAVHDDLFAELGTDQSSRPAGRNQRYLFGRRSHHESTESSRARRRRRDTVDSDTVDSDTVDSDTVDSDTVDSDTVDSDTVDSDTVDSDTVDSDTVDSITADTVFEMFHSEHRRRETIRRDRTIDQD
jgi:hypothetical protein